MFGGWASTPFGLGSDGSNQRQAQTRSISSNTKGGAPAELTKAFIAQFRNQTAVCRVDLKQYHVGMIAGKTAVPRKFEKNARTSTAPAAW